MRRFAALLSAVVLGALVWAAPVAAQEASQRCGGGEVDGVVKTGTDGADSVTVCVAGVGSVTAAEKPDGGYIAADGDSGNPAVLGGYVAYSDKGVDCSDSGNYNYDGNHSCP